jgi:D-xylose 1-dehydrogenase (NADP+, D-xylono-1,5-lactone-forming)
MFNNLPASRHDGTIHAKELDMTERLNWGIIGTGNIAQQFCSGVNAAQRGRLAAVGSRQLSSAEDFARRFQVAAAHGSYEQVLDDPQVQAVYISLPNTMHHEWTIRALRAGKHVLCEKPLAANATEAAEMFTEAERAGRVLVEAFMYRTHPMMRAVQQAVKDGAIGQLRLIRSSFCYRTTRIDGNIRFDPALAGGALMDIGCYCISFSRLFAGQQPQAMHAAAKLHPRGVDEYTAGVLQFPGGVVASFTCGMTVQADNTAHLCGDEGYIEIPIPWKPPSKQAVFTIARGTPPRMDGANRPAPPPRETRTIDANMDLYGLEADAFAEVVLDNAPPFVSREDSLGLMRTLDELRRQIGVR